MKKILEKIKSIKKDIKALEAKIHSLNAKIFDELRKLNDISAEVALYIIFKGYPKEVRSFPKTYETIKYDSYKNIKLKPYGNYGLTDIIGLTEEEFKKLCQYLNVNESD